MNTAQNVPTRSILRLASNAAIMIALAGVAQPAQAQVGTTRLTFTSARLAPIANVMGIPGVKKLVFTFTVPGRLYPNECYNDQGGSTSTPTAYTDGVNTLATLEAAGFTTGGNSLYACTGNVATQITYWSIAFGATEQLSPSEYLYYASVSEYLPNGINVTSVQTANVINGAPTHLEQDNAASGTWKVKYIK